MARNEPKAGDLEQKGRKNGEGAGKTDKHGSADYADGNATEGTKQFYDTMMLYAMIL